MPGSLRTVLLLFPAAVLALLLVLFFRLKAREEPKQALAVKVLCTLVPVVLCLNGCIVTGYPGFWLLFAGLVCCLVGDAVIDGSLPAGTAAFLTGHGLFIACFVTLRAPDPLALPVFLVLFALTAFLFRRHLRSLKGPRLLFVLYAAVILAMLSLALTLPYRRYTLLMAGGALAFTVSDLLLARGLLRGKSASRVADVVSLSCYYAGLYLFALSVWM